jgi:hypothetical protein
MSKNIRIALATAAVLSMPCAHADMTVRQFRKLASTSPATLGTYLDGLTEGATWSAVASIVTKGPESPLFCLPGNLPLTNDTAKHLVLNSSAKGDDYAAPTLLKELQKAFPCKP